MGEILERVYSLVWGVPMLVLILGVGLYLSLRTGFAQLRLFPRACKDFWQRLRCRDRCEGVSPFQALCTALAATVGTGNLAGVAGAIAIGGPGSIFWMWICALLGMVIKLAEVVLAVRFRVRENGELLGGPMYVISRGMGEHWSWMGSVYCFFGVVAAFGVGNATQINTVITGINGCILTFGGTPTVLGNILIGIALSIAVLILLLGGASRIGRATELLVPIAAAGYLLLGLMVLILRLEALPDAFFSIIQGAFHPSAVTGGVVGSLMGTLRIGVSRGVFTNEAGMGTASIAHGSANASHPVAQGLLGIMEVFLDTIVICTMTALVILCSGIRIPYGSDVGVSLTANAFSAVLGEWVQIFITAALCLFAFATVLGWGLYGARCAQYLFGGSVWHRFAWFQAGTVILGAVLSTGTVWLLAEIVNGLMAIPNLIVLAVLCPELCRLIIDYQKKTGLRTGGGNKCKFPSTQTAVNPLLCGNSTPSPLRQRGKERKSII